MILIAQPRAAYRATAMLGFLTFQAMWRESLKSIRSRRPGMDICCPLFSAPLGDMAVN
jgi:hypothetical protein